MATGGAFLVNERTNETSSCERNFFFPCTPCPRKLRSYRQVDLELSKKVLILEVGGLLSKYWGSQRPKAVELLVGFIITTHSMHRLLLQFWLHARCVCYSCMFGCMHVASVTTFLVACALRLLLRFWLHATPSPGTALQPLLSATVSRAAH